MARGNPGHDRIAVVDFGGQYAHLIATKVRRLGVYSEIRQPEDPIEDFKGYRGIIVSGSPSLSSHGEDSDYTRAIYDLPIPILGLCFGHQEIAKHYGGQVVHGGREWGRAQFHRLREHPLFAGLSPVEQVWMSHFDSVTAVGEGFEELGYTVDAAGKEHRFAALGSDSLRRYGFQFHAEVDDTVHGEKMLENFVLGVCGCRPTWNMKQYLEDQLRSLKERLTRKSVFLLASGGVDSTVAAVLLGRAVGPERLHLLHVDNGLMRKDESRKVLETFAQLKLDHNLHFVDASEQFLSALEGVIEPEQKRRIIGETFVRVFNEQAEKLGIRDHLLAQGTIYPDTIETGGTRRADVIKTHHNRVPVIEEMIRAGQVVEPLAELYKVEVRALGRELGLPREAVNRHPFPGPGLGVRLLCSDGREDRSHFSEIEAALPAVAGRFSLQTLALPIRSVGVKADLRAYEHPVMLSGAAEWSRLQQAMNAITAEVPHVNRCIWNLSPIAPKSAQAVAGTINRERLAVLREADAVVMEGLRRHGVYDAIWQCPTVLVPLSLGPRPGELVVIRPVLSERAMTAAAAELPPRLLEELRDSLLSLRGVSAVALDLTSKPPGTIEWE